MILTSARLQLVPYSPCDWPILQKWAYDERLTEFFRDRPRVMRQTELQSFNAGEEVFLVYLRETAQPVGLIQAIDTDKPSRTFYMGNLVDPEFQKQRITPEAYYLTLDYMFNRRGFHKAIVEVLEGRKELIKVLSENGFRFEGTLYEEAFIDGKHINEVRYSMTANYFNRHFKKEQ